MRYENKRMGFFTPFFTYIHIFFPSLFLFFFFYKVFFYVVGIEQSRADRWGQGEDIYLRLVWMRWVGYI
jgi:hypothetical protein